MFIKKRFFSSNIKKGWHPFQKDAIPSINWWSCCLRLRSMEGVSPLSSRPATSLKGMAEASSRMARPLSVRDIITLRSSSIPRLRETSFITSRRLSKGVMVLVLSNSLCAISLTVIVSSSHNTIKVRYWGYVMPRASR